MNVLLLGATGRLGKLILQELLSNGYHVTALVRYPDKIEIQNQQLKIVKGLPTDLSDLTTAITGCDKIIGALNISRTSDFPWARLRTPKTLLSDTMKNIIALSANHKLQRVITCSAYGVAETRDHIPGWFKWFIDNSRVGLAYQDHERQEELVRNSNLSWTIVRPAGLTNSTRTKPIIVSYHNRPKPKLTISRLSVAQFMVAALKDDSLIGKSPVLSS